MRTKKHRGGHVKYVLCPGMCGKAIEPELAGYNVLYSNVLRQVPEPVTLRLPQVMHESLLGQWVQGEWVGRLACPAGQGVQGVTPTPRHREDESETGARVKVHRARRI